MKKDGLNLLGDAVKSTAIFSVILCFLFSIAKATPITFDEFDGTFPCSENGFTVTPTQTPAAGPWQTYGGGIGIYGGGSSPSDPSAGTIEIALNGNSFFFNSAALGEGYGDPGQFSFTGLLDGSTVFSFDGALPYYFFTPVADPFSSDPIDTLLITLSVEPGFWASYGIDNIDVQAAHNLNSDPVPDNAPTITLLGLSFFALMIFRFRNPRQIRRTIG
ncbi:MAG: hypothetical protein ACREFE_04045 [Limisphaerales bacterium]